MSRSLLIPLCLAILLTACKGEPAATPTVIETQEVASPEEGGAVSTAPVQPLPQATPPPPPAPAAPDWSPRELAPGHAWLGCALDYADAGDGEPLTGLDREQLRAALEPCVESDVLRLRYRGKINSDLVALVERVTRTADALGIDSRVLDIDSAGGQVEDAIRVGDWIGGSHWTIWIREDSVCHSACVFVLGSGDTRVVGGRVGIHRIIRLSSTATTRAELNAELTAVYARVREYLERNGVSTVLADLMKSVPNRSLRLLTHDELRQYGLDGANPAQDDLDRVRLLAKCGDDFMRRRDAYVRAFDDRCRAPGREVAALNTCGLELRGQFGFPDESCPIESPLSEFNTLAAVPTDAGSDAPAGQGAETTGEAPAADAGDRGLAQDRPAIGAPAMAAESAALASVRDHVDADVDLAALRTFLSAHQRLFVLTGAGCSTGSGIPDYRDDAGAWKRPQPVTFQAFVGDDAVRRRYWARSLVGWPRFAMAQPNDTHRALAALEAQGRVELLLTQNVDRLHQAAGSNCVIDLHGRLDRVRCLACGDDSSRDALQRRLLEANPGWSALSAGMAPDGDADLDGVDFSRFSVPACLHCGGMLKPDVVFFGESVPRARVGQVQAHLAAADALLVVGSSLMVWSGFRFVRQAADAGLPLAAVNLGRTRADELLSLKVARPCVQALTFLLG